MADYISRPVHHLDTSSPLDTLVRRTSSRRQGATAGPSSQPGDRLQLSNSQTPPKKRLGRPPSSPLLHTHFRSSVATTASYNTSLDVYNRTMSTVGDPRESYYDDDGSIYSSGTMSQYIPNLPSDARYNGGTYSTSEQDERYGGWQANTSTDYDPRRRSSDVDPFMRERAPDPVVPTVVVSTADPAPDWRPTPTSAPGRVPSALPSGVNYSRPVHPRSPAADDEKRKVLERNAHRGPSPQPSPQPSPRSPAGTFQRMQDAPRGGARSPHGSSLSPSPSPSPSPLSRSASPESPRALSPSARGTGRSFPSPGPQTASTAQTITLPRDPPPIPSSPGSLYSAYSYYQLDTPQQSPTGATLQVPGSPRATPQLSQPPRRAPDDGMTADSYLQLGIQHHEANRLTESAAAFEQSAKMDGGSGVGMLMWGLTLRHGWGTEKNEKLAFSWLRRAAEAAVGDLEKARMGVDTSAVKGELVLAIYEVGQCFFQGWGVKKDQKMAVSYFQVAAKLGDADAQTELAFCLANGRGCKKDRKEAAKWYRAAVAQGVSDVGLAWIYKEKFQ